MKAVVLLLAISVAACSTTASDLRYSPALAPILRGTPAIATVAVQDARDEKDPTYVGAIRGGYGNPLKTLVTPKPIAEEVADAFGDALRQRNLLGPNAPERLDIRLTKFSVNQYLRRDASVAFTLHVLNQQGVDLYQDSVDVNVIQAPRATFDIGAFASIEDFRATMVQTLTEAVDQAVNKPAFLAALAQR